MTTAYFRISAAALLASSAPGLAQAQQQYQPIQAQPAATQASVINLDNRIVTLERQLADILRAEEENARRISQLETQLTQEREASAQRIAVLESKIASAAAAPVETAEPAATKPVQTAAAATSKPKPIPAIASDESDPAEQAYDAGYQLWKAGKYDAAIGALKAFTSAYPSHRRASWANNLAGRAMLDKGEPRAAAEVLLANYRGNPKGERAADSLYYLGQSLVKLDQPSQACKAYAELEAVYGATMRADLKKMLPDAKSEAKCRG
ncbi:MAG: outer membrane protein assembly factor BamD [Sphingomonas sp.]|nr:outer membrane protein assembly factor BamD [Sphingomonas sp.]